VHPGSAYTKLLVSSGLSNLADGVFQIALPLVTLGVTRDPTAFAAVTVALRLPWLLFALPAGALADRLDRRRTMFLVDLARAAVIGGLALALATGTTTLWLLCAVALLLGIGETLFDTAAQSIVPNIVPADDLSRANGNLYAVELTMNQFVGPLVGGVLVGLTATGAVAGSAAAYLCAAAAIAVIAGSFRPERTGPPTRIREDVVEGARYLFSHRLLRTMALLTGIANLTSTAMLTVFPLYAVDPGPMGLSEADYGVLLTAGAGGAFAGSFVAAGAERVLGRSRSMLVAFLLFGVATVAPGLTTSAPLVAAGQALGGAGAITWNVITVSLRQRIAPDHLLGRVNAGYRLLAWGSMPLGALLGGVAADLLSVRAVFFLTTGGALVALPLLLAVVTERAITDAEAEAEGSATSGGDGGPEDEPAAAVTP
jgi:MFS family permease